MDGLSVDGRWTDGGRKVDGRWTECGQTMNAERVEARASTAATLSLASGPINRLQRSGLIVKAAATGFQWLFCSASLCQTFVRVANCCDVGCGIAQVGIILR